MSITRIFSKKLGSLMPTKTTSSKALMNRKPQQLFPADWIAVLHLFAEHGVIKRLFGNAVITLEMENKPAKALK